MAIASVRSGKGRHVPSSEQVIWRGMPAERPTCVSGDIDGDGDDEFVVTVRRPVTAVYWFDRSRDGTWTEHLLDPAAPTMGVGGVLVDLTGDGRLSLISGNDDRGSQVFWWEQPEDPRQPWVRRVAFDLPGVRTHDMIVADLDEDGWPELVVWNQGAQAILHVPLPGEPRKTPWEGVTTIVTGVEEQALAVCDVDGDGALELVAGCSWYKRDGRGRWKQHRFAQGFRAPRLGAADFDGDGRDEIALAESDGSFEGITFGRLAVFKPSADVEASWEYEVLCDKLLDPHTLQVADFDGDGRPEIYTGDMGLGDWTEPHAPVQRLYFNRGTHWEEEVFGAGRGVHEGQVLRVGGRISVIGKPFKALLNPDGPRPQGADELVLWQW